MESIHRVASYEFDPDCYYSMDETAWMAMGNRRSGSVNRCSSLTRYPHARMGSTFVGDWKRYVPHTRLSLATHIHEGNKLDDQLFDSLYRPYAIEIASLYETIETGEHAATEEMEDIAEEDMLTQEL